MRVAVHTNVLVRFFTRDNLQQAAVARAALLGERMVISTVALCELVWVLKRGHRYSNADIGAMLGDFMAARNVEVDRPAAEAGLRMLARGGDFADGVIEHEATRARCDRLVTFDPTFARLAAGSAVALLPAT